MSLSAESSPCCSQCDTLWTLVTVPLQLTGLGQRPECFFYGLIPWFSPHLPPISWFRGDLQHSVDVLSCWPMLKVRRKSTEAWNLAEERRNCLSSGRKLIERGRGGWEGGEGACLLELQKRGESEHQRSPYNMPDNMPHALFLCNLLAAL